MSRQSIHHSRATIGLPDDFPERLKRFRGAFPDFLGRVGSPSGTHPLTIRRWIEGKSLPNAQHVLALLDVADALGLGHLLT